MGRQQQAIAPSDLSYIEQLFSTNGLTGKPAFIFSNVDDRWEVFEDTDLTTLVAYLCTENLGWNEPE